MLPKSIVYDFTRNYNFAKRVVIFDDKWFKSVLTYSALLLSDEFWKEFIEYEKILICHVDAILLKNADNLASLPYSFIGPRLPITKCRLINGKIYENYRKHFFLPYRSIQIGGGGISLRNVRDSLEVIGRAKSFKNSPRFFSGEINEDIVFGYLFKKYGHRLPSAEFTDTIFLEYFARELKDIPMIYGFHGLYRFNPDLEDKIFETFLKD